MRYWIIGIILVLVDQIAKAMVRLNMELGEAISVIGDFFRITYVQNTGAAFNSLAGNRVILIVIPIVFITICSLYMQKHKDEHWSFYLSMAMIISGGIGNLIDRILYGFVTDMLDFSVFPPVFNVADIGVTAGCALLIFSILIEEKLKKQNGK